MKEDAKKVAELLKLLANENRMLILCALIEGPKTVGRIADQVLGISRSALSQHLHLLKTAGILSSDKHAQNVIYSLADHRIEDVVATLKKHYCKEDPSRAEG